MSDIKVGGKFKYYSIEINTLMDVVSVKDEELTILGISDHYYVFSDPFFTRISVDKSAIYAKPEEVTISEETSKTMIDIFGKFRVSIYSQMSKKRIENKLNREFNKWLAKKIGIYGAAKKINIKL